MSASFLNKLMVSFIALTSLLGTPDAYCGKKGNEETTTTSKTPKLKAKIQDGKEENTGPSLNQAVLFEIWVLILSYLPPEELITTNLLVSHFWSGVAHTAVKVKTPDLSEKKFTNKQLTALGKIPFYGLILRKCELNSAASEILSGFQHLKLLDLEDSEIGDADTAILANGKLTNLTSLNLGANSIGAEGAAALAKALTTGNLSGLTSLDLGFNSIGVKGAKALADADWPNLTSLNLGCNGIKEEGIIELADALTTGKLGGLTSLNLGENNILWGHHNNYTKEQLKIQLNFIRKLRI